MARGKLYRRHVNGPPTSFDPSGSQFRLHPRTASLARQPNREARGRLRTTLLEPFRPPCQALGSWAGGSEHRPTTPWLV